MSAIVGLDIGGANLKAAHTNGAALSRPFPLWRTPALLPGALAQLLAEMPPHDLLAVTMTGELCDCFASKSEGVAAILASVTDAARVPVRVWTTAGRFIDLAAARAQPLRVAAANWLALAHLAGRQVSAEPALLLDTGSTTTDIVYLDCGKPCPRGWTDQERLDTGELVYTGVRRTPVCAVLGREVAAEFFATMLDAYLVLGLWPEAPNDLDTADRRPVTRRHAHARLARLRCADADDLSAEAVQELARRALTRQVAHVRQAVARVLRDRLLPQRVIVSGSGEILGRQVAKQHAQLPLVALSALLGQPLSEAAAAYAVAVLAQEGAA